jgi:hypothetical protein
MTSIISEYRNRNLLVKWINSHQHHTCVYMGTVLFPFSYIIEQLKAPNSVSQSSQTHVFLFSQGHISWILWGSPFSNTYPMTCARVHLSTYGNIVRVCSPSLFPIFHDIQVVCFPGVQTCGVCHSTISLQDSRLGKLFGGSHVSRE